MVALHHACVVVVREGDAHRSLLHRLRRMNLRNVLSTGEMDDARLLGEADAVDAFLVVLPKAIPDAKPPVWAHAEAPGLRTGIPALLLAETVTPELRERARCAGYIGVVPERMPPRMLYRCLAGLLQEAKRAERARAAGAAGSPRQRSPVRHGVLPSSATALFEAGKSKLQ